MLVFFSILVYNVIRLIWHIGVHRTMRIISSSAHLNEMEVFGILLMLQNHECCLQSGPLFLIFLESFWWFFNIFPRLEAIFLDFPPIIVLWIHYCLGKCGFLLAVIVGSWYFDNAERHYFLHPRYQSYIPRSVFFRMLVNAILRLIRSWNLTYLFNPIWFVY